MINGYETRAQLEAVIDGLEREKGAGNINARWLKAIEAQQRIFQAELESLGEGDYAEPEGHPALGTAAWVSTAGRGRNHRLRRGWGRFPSDPPAPLIELSPRRAQGSGPR